MGKKPSPTRLRRRARGGEDGVRRREGREEGKKGDGREIKLLKATNYIRMETSRAKFLISKPTCFHFLCIYSFIIIYIIIVTDNINLFLYFFI